MPLCYCALGTRGGVRGRRSIWDNMYAFCELSGRGIDM